MSESLATEDTTTPTLAPRNGQETFEFLLRRMRLKADFPALSDSVGAINRLTASEDESVGRLAEVLLKDFALTNKLLRLVNAAHYRQAGGGTISTVSRAIVVLGFDAVRNLALTVLLFEHLEDKANAQALKESFLRASLAGQIARASCRSPLLRRQAEEAYICALFHDLGRLLAQYYFPEEYAEIERRLAGGISPDAAACQVLGISFEELGIGIARHWGFPATLIGSMRRLPEGTLSAPSTAEEALRLVAGYAHEMCEAMANGAVGRDALMQKIGARFGTSLEIDARAVGAQLEKAFGEMRELAAVLHLDLAHSPFARQVARYAGMPLVEDSESSDLEIPQSARLEQAEEGSEKETIAAEDTLAAGIRDMSAMLLEEHAVSDVLRILVETLYRGLACQRVVLALRDARSGFMIGRFGLGPASEEFVRQFRFPLGAPPTDVFQLALARGADVLISDVDDAHIADKVPAWWRKATGAKTFLLLPMLVKGRAVALVYGERERAGSLVLPERTLGLVKALRNQALLALKQVA